jgi:hypothetical protein
LTVFSATLPQGAGDAVYVLVAADVDGADAVLVAFCVVL